MKRHALITAVALIASVAVPISTASAAPLACAVSISNAGHTANSYCARGTGYHRAKYRCHYSQDVVGNWTYTPWKPIELWSSGTCPSGGYVESIFLQTM